IARHGSLSNACQSETFPAPSVDGNGPCSGARMSPFLDFPAMKGLLEARLNALGGPLRILEAGCGRDWPLHVSVPYTLTGLDLDPDALAARTDLDEAIIGDLRTAELPAHSFDVVYSAFVLEHVSGA